MIRIFIIPKRVDTLVWFTRQQRKLEIVKQRRRCQCLQRQRQRQRQQRRQRKVQPGRLPRPFQL